MALIIPSEDISIVTLLESVVATVFYGRALIIVTWLGLVAATVSYGIVINDWTAGTCCMTASPGVV